LNGIQTQALLGAIESAIVAAWAPPGDSPKFPVSWSDPRLPIGGADGLVSAPDGYAVIRPLAVQMSFSQQAAAVGTVNQENSFEILGRFPWPSDPSVLILTSQISAANALIAHLQTGPSFASIGLLPLVSRVGFIESGEPNNAYFDVSLRFDVVTRNPHH